MKKYVGLFFIVVGLGLAGCGKIKHELRGEMGSPGARGEQGPAGPAGLDGQDGEQGIPGQAAVLEVIDPCGDAPGVVDEVILRLANGQLLASFSQNASGLNTRFAILAPGTYQTTDGSNCVFTVTSEGAIQ